jgi:hypothetical protein
MFSVLALPELNDFKDAFFMVSIVESLSCLISLFALCRFFDRLLDSFKMKAIVSLFFSSKPFYLFLSSHVSLTFSKNFLYSIIIAGYATIASIDSNHYYNRHYCRNVYVPIMLRELTGLNIVLGIF